ncbi:MAG: hypothetical protein AB7G15_08515 [Alphaproteobacteria bacterium]
MRSIAIRSGLFALAACFVGVPAGAQDLASKNFSPLLFNPNTNEAVFRISGAPWVCPAAEPCVRLKFDKIADTVLPGAGIVALGIADRNFYVSLQHTAINAGRAAVYNCTKDGCFRDAMDVGEFTSLGSYSARQSNRTVGKAAILRRSDRVAGKSQIFWCSDAACAEIPLTRENNYELSFLGRARFEARDRVWLRDKSGLVLTCFQDDVDKDDELKCEPTQLAFGVLPATAQPVDPAEPNQAAIAAALDAALRGGNLIDADRWLGEGLMRFPGHPTWAQYQQRIAQARAQQAAAQRLQQARQSIAEARRFAAAGDFVAAESMLQQANRLSPNLAEIAQARTEIARLRVERDQRYSQRAQYDSAIQQALGAYNLWEAERLLGDAGRRFPNDQGFNNYRTRLAQIRAERQWLQRVAQAREFVAGARRSIALGDYMQADRQLNQAEQSAPGLPEIAQARADVSRLRIETEMRNDEIRQFTVAINAEIERRRYASAERLLADANRRFPRHAAWNDFRRHLDQVRTGDTRPGDTRPGNQQARIAEARDLIAVARRLAAAGNFAEAETRLVRAQTLVPDLPELRQARIDIERQKREADAKETAQRVQRLVAEARQEIRQKDFAAADRAVDQAEKLSPRAPEVVAVRAELNRARADAARQETEIRTLTGSIDTALDRKQLPEAERLLADAVRRYPNHAGWTELQRRLAQAKTANERDARNKQAIDFVAAARRAATVGNWGQAEQSLKQAETAAPDLAEVKAARAEIARLKQQDDAKQDSAAKAAAERVQRLVVQARESIGKRDFPAADRAIDEAEKLNANAPDVKAVRAEYARAQAEAARQDAEARGLSVAIGGAIDRKQFDQAEKLLTDATRRYPNNPAWADLQKRLTQAKATTTPPPVDNNAKALALVAEARKSAAEGDFDDAERDLKLAEAAAPELPQVKAARADIDRMKRDATAAPPAARVQRFIAQARQAIRRNNLVNAERAVDEAEKLAPDAADVKAVRAELEAAKKAAPPPRRQ